MEHATRPSRDGGFTVIEAMVAVTVLALGVMITIQPVIGSLRRVADARSIEVAENLAQAEIESLRALDYEDIGLPGQTPGGVLTESRVIDVEGRNYTVALEVWYAGSLTGLEVVPQGGDGVEGSWDPGVDYKAVKVTVLAEGREHDPVIMETIVAPPSLGAHEAIANARIFLAAHEPFASSELDLPSLRVVSPPTAPIASSLHASEVVFPAIPPGSYTVGLNDAGGWLIHPADIVSGADVLELVPGSLSETTLRVYRPASLELTVIDDATGAPVPEARLTLTHVPTGQQTAYSPGVFAVSGLIPDAYDLVLSATGYFDWTATSVNIPAGYPDPMHQMTVRMIPLPPPTTTTTTTTIPGTTTTIGGTTTTTVGGTTTTTIDLGTLRSVRFTVRDNIGRRIKGATVTVPHPNLGVLTAITDKDGWAWIDLEEDYVYTAVASTPWGHGNGMKSFDPYDDTTISLYLTRPSNQGLMGLEEGDNAEFLYKPYGGSTWTVMPVNFEGEASFVASQGWYTVAKRCLSNGNVVDQRNVWVSANDNREEDLYTWCQS